MTSRHGLPFPQKMLHIQTSTLTPSFQQVPCSQISLGAVSTELAIAQASAPRAAPSRGLHSCKCCDPIWHLPGPSVSPQKSSRLYSDATSATSATSSDAHHTERLEQSPRKRACPLSNPGLATSWDVHDVLDARLVRLFPKSASRYISSPSVSSSDESC
jgi:hypothetical protein